MTANLKGYKGNVKKTATVYCNDPQSPRAALVLQGKVRTLIDVRPASSVSFRGMAEKVKDQAVELVATTQPFHVTRVDTDLEGKVASSLEPIEDGKHCRLKLSNLLKQGSYNGFVRLHTDFPQKSEILIRVFAIIEGGISVSPRALVVGKTAAGQPVRTGKVIVSSNNGKPFKIRKLVHDQRPIQVTQSILSNQGSVSLEIVPRMENTPAGARRQTVLAIETDMASEANQAVQEQVLNLQ